MRCRLTRGNDIALYMLTRDKSSDVKRGQNTLTLYDTKQNQILQGGQLCEGNLLQALQGPPCLGPQKRGPQGPKIL